MLLLRFTLFSTPIKGIYYRETVVPHFLQHFIPRSFNSMKNGLFQVVRVISVDTFEGTCHPTKRSHNKTPAERRTKKHIRIKRWRALETFAERSTSMLSLTAITPSCLLQHWPALHCITCIQRLWSSSESCSTCWHSALSVPVDLESLEKSVEASKIFVLVWIFFHDLECLQKLMCTSILVHL